MSVRRLPETYPLSSISVEEAKRMQFRLMDTVCAHFKGDELLQSDLGVTPEWGRPSTTKKVEEVLVNFFRADGCALVQGAGTGAIRAMLDAALPARSRILIHDAPPYATSRQTFESKGLDLVRANFNDPDVLRAVTQDSEKPKVALVQHSRQRPEDRYDLAEVVRTLGLGGITTLTDENYTAFKVPKIGTEVGADASAFSMFKLLGPEGVGCVVGSNEIVDRIHDSNYSGGGQVQGHQALDVLRGLLAAPILWAVQTEVVAEVVDRLKRGEVSGVAGARIANGQDRMIMILFDQPIAEQVVRKSAQFGAQNYPVGANSRYEMAPLFYRLSGSFLEANAELAAYAIRVNPVRAGTDLVLSILRESVEEAVCS